MFLNRQSRLVSGKGWGVLNCAHLAPAIAGSDVGATSGITSPYTADSGELLTRGIVYITGTLITLCLIVHFIIRYLLLQF